MLLRQATHLAAEPSLSGHPTEVVPSRQTTCGQGAVEVGNPAEAVLSRQVEFGGGTIEVGHPVEEMNLRQVVSLAAELSSSCCPAEAVTSR